MTTQYVLSVIRNTLARIDNIENTDDISSLTIRLEYLNRVIACEGFQDSFVSSLGHVISILKDVESAFYGQFETTTLTSGRRGRPSFNICQEQLEFLVENDFKIPEIGKMLGVSSRTVERRLSSFGISISGKYSDVSDIDLDKVVKKIQEQHPGVGLRMLKGHLKSQGLYVPTS